MARNNKPKVTHTQILVWAILHKEAQRKDEALKLTRLEETVADPAMKANLGDMLRKSIDEHDQVLDILRQLYHIETGSEF